MKSFLFLSIFINFILVVFSSPDGARSSLQNIFGSIYKSSGIIEKYTKLGAFLFKDDNYFDILNSSELTLGVKKLPNLQNISLGTNIEGNKQELSPILVSKYNLFVKNLQKESKPSTEEFYKFFEELITGVAQQVHSLQKKPETMKEILPIEHHIDKFLKFFSVRIERYLKEHGDKMKEEHYKNLLTEFCEIINEIPKVEGEPEEESKSDEKSKHDEGNNPDDTNRTPGSSNLWIYLTTAVVAIFIIGGIVLVFIKGRKN